VTMGHEVCGVVVATDDSDAAWIGRRVVCETYFSTDETCEHCRAGRRNLCLQRRSIGSFVDGAFAPRLVVPVSNLHRVPDWLPSPAASLSEPLACVCHCLLDPAAVDAGDDVLVVGPGPIGLLAAQVARASGGVATVVGIERDRDRLEIASQLGFEAVIGGEALGDGFGVVVDCSGHQGGMRLALQHARRGGRYVQIGLAGKDVTLPFDEVCFRELTITSGNASTPTSWRRALRLIETRAVDLEPLVSAVYPLARWDEAVSAARSGAGVKYVLDPRDSSAGDG
jgi:L-iditol 2-dehydrogenase